MTKKKKRICIIAPSLQMGGIERALSNLANYFVTQGHEIHFLTLFPFKPFFKLDPRIKLYVPPYSFPHRGRSIFQTLTYYYKMLGPCGYFRKEMKKIKPDTILSFGDWFPHLIMLQLAGLKIPFYYGNRSNPNIKYGLLENAARTLAYKLNPPAGIIAQTTEAKNRKKRILGTKVPIKIIPNPVREITHQDVAKEDWIVSVGRLHLEKGFVRVMEAFSKIDNMGWKLMLAGGGVHEEEIKQKAHEFGLTDKVVFLGKVNNIEQLLLKSKIFVLGSHKEGYPNALLEAMAAGLACISFDIVAGPKDIIRDGQNGFLIPDNDISLMAEKMKLLINNEELRNMLGSNAKEIVNTNSIENLGNEFLDFIL